MPYDLRDFGMAAMLECGIALRRAVADAPTLEHAANAIVHHLYDNCVTPETGERACVLVRFYKTHPFGLLEPNLQYFVRRARHDVVPTDTMRCLTLLGTVGVQETWNSRKRSRAHCVIPLPSAEIVQRAPMIAQLIKQFGLELGAVVRPSPELVAELGNRTYNVFHVEDARGSPFIPAQEDFVIPFGVRSVVGIGGSLMTGELFAVILFSRIHIPKASAQRLRNVALDIKASIFHFRENQVFASGGPTMPKPVA